MSVPNGFWPQIDHQLQRIRTEKPGTFDGVRAVLLDPAYGDVATEVHRNGPRSFDTDSAFFAGSGGDPQLSDALEQASWQRVNFTASYHYVMSHPATGEVLTYIEGDVLRGNHMI